LTLYSNDLAKKPQIIVLNKLDIPGAKEAADIFQSAVKGKKIELISAITGKGVNHLKSQIVQLLNVTH
jgi:GTP-binding protein